MRDLRERADDPNGSADRFQPGLEPLSILSDRRLGIDRGKSGNSAVTPSAPGGSRTIKDLIFWILGLRRSEAQPSSRIRSMSKRISRGVVLARSRLNPAKFLLLPVDTEVQWSGVEMMSSRQYRQTCVSGMIWRIRCEIGPSWTYRAILEMISGGNLFTGRNAFRKEGMRSRTSCTVISRFSI